MKHFDHCRCESCRVHQSCPPPAPCGYLMQKIVSEGQCDMRCRQFCLSLSPLPRILVPPYSVRDARVCGDAAVSDSACGDLSVTLPLHVTVCDRQGNSHTAAAELPLCISMRKHTREDAAGYITKARVSLCQSPACFDDPAQVSVCLTVCVQVYGVSPQALYSPRPAAPECPPLPLYPPPCRPDRI